MTAVPDIHMHNATVEIGNYVLDTSKEKNKVGKTTWILCINHVSLANLQRMTS